MIPGFVALNDRVLIRPTNPEKSPGGLVLPDSYKDKEGFVGVALAVGPGKLIGRLTGMPGSPLDVEYRRLCTVKPGDTVFYTNYGSHPVEFEGKEYRVASEEDLLGYVPQCEE